MPSIRRIKSNGLFAEFINEWPDFGPNHNWRTFHPFMLEIEDDRIMGAFEFSLVILLIGFRVRWTYTETETMAGIKQSMADIKAGTAQYTTLTPEELLRKTGEPEDGNDRP